MQLYQIHFSQKIARKNVARVNAAYASVTLKSPRMSDCCDLFFFGGEGGVFGDIAQTKSLLNLALCK